VNDAAGARPLRLMLLGGFTLLRGTEEIVLPMSAQRLVAFLALRDRALSRAYLAGMLWPDCPAERSLADLRMALWRANHSGVPLVAGTGLRLCLHSDVRVDVRMLVDLARGGAARRSVSELPGISWWQLSLDLLPDWYDDWLVDDREGVRQLRLHALEHLTAELSVTGRHAEAIQAALAAVRVEPLRETAHAALIRAHLAEGNRSEAVRQYNRCCDILARELGVEPSDAVTDLVPVRPEVLDPRVPATAAGASYPSAGTPQK
jgi:DNA-binding SARP family transcriptional activator